MAGPAPLLVTAMLDPATHAWLTALRRRHFPAERNHLDAHLTLFHHLEGSAPAGVRAVLADVAPAAPLPATVARVLRLGRGVALGIDAPGLAELRTAIAERVPGPLTRQDARWGRPHVTVQNKVEPARAAALAAALEASFAPAPAAITGLALWRYLGGPWAPVAEVPFGSP